MKHSFSCTTQQQLQLTLTPSLTQAIGLLQLSHYELYEEIDRFLEKNPFLTLESPAVFKEVTHDYDYTTEINNHTAGSLTDYLHEQLILMHFDQHLYNLGCELIYELDESGFLNHEFFNKINSRDKAQLIEWLKELDPPGIGASCMTESLCWQLELKKDPLSPLLIEFLSQENLSRISLKNFQEQYQLSEKEIKNLSCLFHSLTFNPAEHFHQSDTVNLYQQPDLLVYKNNNRFEVKLNEELIPKLTLHRLEQKAFQERVLKELNQSAKYFIKIINTRFETLLKTATLLVNYQQDFFYYGPAGLKTLILEDVAQEIGLHESTISRIISNKLIQTPLGIFDLKILLSRGIKKKSGESVSTASIKEMLIQMIHYENPAEPLSDQQLTDTLKRQGFCIARRTITKYRKQLSLPTSVERKQR
jgi:RNA polymerase sigma-54 factor